MSAVIIAIVGAVAAAIATGAAMWQAALLRRQLQNEDSVRLASFYQSVVSLFIQVDLLFLERPDMRPYFYDGKSPESHEKKQEALSVAEFFADVAESCTAAESVLPHLLGDWDDYFNYVYRNSPILREYWANFGHLYPDRVKRTFVGPSARPKQWPGGGEGDADPASPLGP